MQRATAWNGSDANTDSAKAIVERAGNRGQLERVGQKNHGIVALDARARQLDSNRIVDHRVCTVDTDKTPLPQERNQMDRGRQAAAAEIEDVVVRFQPLAAEELVLPVPDLGPVPAKRDPMRRQIGVGLVLPPRCAAGLPR